jgi:hypothetical protein
MSNFELPAGMPPWLPAAVIIPLFVLGAVLFSVLFGRRMKIRTVSGSSAAHVTQGIVGLLSFRSAAMRLVIVMGVVVAIFTVFIGLPWSVPATAAALLVSVLAYLRSKRAVQKCYVEPNGTITLVRGNVGIPFDINHFRYARMYISNDDGAEHPSMLVLSRDTRPNGMTWLSSVLLPRVDDERVVLYFSRWWDADGALIVPSMMADLFRRTYVYAGREPKGLDGRLFGVRGWEVDPESTTEPSRSRPQSTPRKGPRHRGFQ